MQLKRFKLNTFQSRDRNSRGVTRQSPTKLPTKWNFHPGKSEKCFAEFHFTQSRGSKSDAVCHQPRLKRPVSNRKVWRVTLVLNKSTVTSSLVSRQNCSSFHNDMKIWRHIGETALRNLKWSCAFQLKSQRFTPYNANCKLASRLQIVNAALFWPPFGSIERVNCPKVIKVFFERVKNDRFTGISRRFKLSLSES